VEVYLSAMHGIARYGWPHGTNFANDTKHIHVRTLCGLHTKDASNLFFSPCEWTMDGTDNDVFVRFTTLISISVAPSHGVALVCV